LELSRELAKQVLSQLSYTPTAGTTIEREDGSTGHVESSAFNSYGGIDVRQVREYLALFRQPVKFEDAFGGPGWLFQEFPDST
jgi:hypothetical protein